MMQKLVIENMNENYLKHIKTYYYFLTAGCWMHVHVAAVLIFFFDFFLIRKHNNQLCQFILCFMFNAYTLQYYMFGFHANFINIILD